jgi:hypothetical protein
MTDAAQAGSAELVAVETQIAGLTPCDGQNDPHALRRRVVRNVLGLDRKHRAQRIDDVAKGLRPGAPRADRARDDRDACREPAAPASS